MNVGRRAISTSCYQDVWGEGAVTGAGEMAADVAVVTWVGQGKAIDSATAMARGSWANVARTKLPANCHVLCSKVARYGCTGDVVSTSSSSGK